MSCKLLRSCRSPIDFRDYLHNVNDECLAADWSVSSSGPVRGSVWVSIWGGTYQIERLIAVIEHLRQWTADSWRSPARRSPSLKLLPVGETAGSSWNWGYFVEMFDLRKSNSLTLNWSRETEEFKWVAVRWKSQRCCGGPPCLTIRWGTLFYVCFGSHFE